MSEQNKNMQNDLSQEQLVRENQELQNEVKYVESKLQILRKEYDKREDELAEVQKKLDQMQQDYLAVIHSSSWRVTAPLRAILGPVSRLLHRSRVMGLVRKVFSSLKHNGIAGTFKKIGGKLSYMKTAKKFQSRNVLTAQERAAQRAATFPKEVTFSILVPLYNTPKKYLIEMIESVLGQTYGGWELCLADGSTDDFAFVGELCKKYAEKDSRIKYQKLEKNMGIVGNSNECIKMATGNYIALFDHDDVLHEAALYEYMKVICERDADFIFSDEMTFSTDISKPIVMHFKADYAVDNLRANNYICHFTAFSRELLDQAGWFTYECEGSQDFDLVLRLTEKAKHIVHVPKILYFWRSHPGSVASSIDVKPYCITSGIKAVNNHLKRLGIEGEAVEAPKLTSIYKINYKLLEQPLISIIIPNRDHLQDLRRCITSVMKISTYKNIEILIVENGSSDPELQEYYAFLRGYDNVRILEWKEEFNYSKINNFAVESAKGKYLLFLNNDIEVITPNWIEEMLMYAQRDDVGAVGAKLYYPDRKIQHAGIILGMRGTAGHAHYHVQTKDGNLGFMGRLYYAQDFMAVTAACMLVSKEDFESVGGFDPEFKVAFNDVDFCLKLYERGKLNVFTPFAELYHYESVSRGSDKKGDNNLRFKEEEQRFKDRWKALIEKGDPYYNPNFSLQVATFMLNEHYYD
ncbi:glycosyltransferase [Neobittarella massiliensis]|uniref:Glycosyltransferase n=1 Tax=Neobittarella massiliensis (ex Bilen et al. 2018) TaxID=2041842 RepID=A0A8J6IQ46_9FIRM|nr:glycosyltransferase [Neobittarella massiliensis]MBC3516306.1 glycosyltransferase [Neobittarella massiliensis]